MKNLLVVVMFLVVTIVNVNGQEYKKFKVGIGLGYAMPSGEGAKGGVLFTLEPAYRISDAFSLGLRLESALIGGESADGEELDISALGSYTLNGQYYLSANKFRPFLGAGFGLYSIGGFSSGSDVGSIEVASESKFGFYPRIGFDAGHFTLALDYNIIGATKVEGSDDMKNSYIGIRLGAFFGGGKN